MAKQIILNLFCIFMTMVSTTSYHGRPFVNEKGDMVIVGFLNYRGTLPGDSSKCHTIRPSDGLLSAIAMKYAVERVNKDQRVLPNKTLGLRIYDVCDEAFLQASVVNSLVARNISGVIGPTNCEDASTVGVAMSLYHIPIMTFNQVPLSIDYRRYYEVQYWVAPNVLDSVQAMCDFIFYMKWNFIGIMYQKNEYGWAASHSLRYCITRRVCTYDVTAADVDTSVEEYSLTFYNRYIKGGEHKASIIALFLEESEIIKFLSGLKMLDEEVVSKYTFLSLSKWGTKQLIVNSNERFSRGVITFQSYYQTPKDFLQYFYSNHFLEENLMKEYAKTLCFNFNKLENCTVTKSMLERTFGDIGYTRAAAVINSVYAFAGVFQHLLQHNAGNYITNNRYYANHIMRQYFTRRDSSRYRRYPMRSDIFEFQKNRRIKSNIGIYNYQCNLQNNECSYKKIGHWKVIAINTTHTVGKLDVNDTAIQWRSTAKPPSSCNVQCKRGQISRALLHYELCCNECQDCNSGQVVVNNTCVHCQLGERPNKDLTVCEKLPYRMRAMNRWLGYFMVTVSCTGIAATLVDLIIFVYFRNEHIIRASSRELTAFIFMGIIVMYTVPLLMLHGISNVVCFIERLFLYVGFTFVYVPLLLKTNRVYRIFEAARTSAVPPKVVSPMSQVMILVVFCLVQVMFCFLRINEVDVGYTYSSSKNYVEMYCKEDYLAFSINFVFVLFIMAATTFYAFKTRHYPKNYNESKYIGLTMYITCFTFAIGLVSYFLVNDKSVKRIIVSLSCLVCGYLVLFVLFTHKLRSLYKIYRDKRSLGTQQDGAITMTQLDVDGLSSSTTSTLAWYFRRVSNTSMLNSPTVEKKCTQ